MAENNTVVTIELDRIRELRFGHRAMKRWSAHTGKPISEMDTDNLSAEDVEVLMFYMLEADAEKHGETLKLEQMEDLLDLAPLGIVYAKIGEAVEAAFPQKAKNVRRAASGTGMKV